ncbi:hypothetical protein BGZ95_000439 [Linnemannia exigua]|uniref:Uncharacterized protein n=1 Tax=Linnemannia exigua TaxID=604196 RepID=A0AAD4DJE7_9FUNG|nr:hypothetical protein BGZ95_000439 [Linnemannia exigua]
MSVCQCKGQGLDKAVEHHPSSSSCSPTSITDIRTQFDQIATNLSTNNASVYSKRWEALCQSSQWKTVYLPPHTLILSSVQRDTFLNNACSIRRLSICNPDIILVNSSCTNLTHLTCRGSLSCDGNNDDHGSHNTDNKIPEHSSLDLICQNPGLQSLSLDHAESVLPHWAVQHLKSFMNLTILRSFSMDFDSMVATPDPIKTILNYCPKSIQELYLTNRRGHFRAPTSSFRLLGQLSSPRSSRPGAPGSSRPFSPTFSNSSKSDNNTQQTYSQPPSPSPSTSSAIYSTSWRTLSELRSLTFECYMTNGQEDLILFPLLRHAPHLERLKVDGIHEKYHARLAVALSTHCPKIKSLELFHLEFTEQELFRLVDIYDGMDRVELCITPEMNRRVIPTLIENSGATLQSVRLLERSFRHPREAATNTNTTSAAAAASAAASAHTHVAQFLAGCPQLTTLEVQPDWASFNSGISLRDLVETNWVSQQLETLILSISESETETESFSAIGTSSEKEIGRSGLCNRSDTNSDDRSHNGSEDQEDQKQEQKQHKQQQIALLVLELSRKLKAQLRLKRVRISWLSPCYQISFATASALTNNELDQEYLHATMGLLWQ